MDLQIDPITLIKAVEKRSAIYDTSSTGYRDRRLKRRLWNEVCQDVYTSSVWSSLTSVDKSTHALEVQKRWESLRHCFRRDVTGKYKGRPGKKKRKYLYFDHLTFLLPFTEAKTSTPVNIDNDTNVYAPNFLSCDDTTENEECDESIQYLDEENLPDRSSPIEAKESKNKRHDEHGEIVTLLKEGNGILRKLKKGEIGTDDDEFFFRSLMPYVKDLSGDQKLLLRVEIMKLIINFKQTMNDT